MSTDKDRESLTLRIKGFRPHTLPMRKLLAYLGKLADLFGNEEHVHFLRVVNGSAAPRIEIDRTAKPEVFARIAASRRPNGPVELVRARTELNDLLAADNTSADLLAADGTRILEFRGRESQVQPVHVIHEPGTLRGKLMRLGGKDDSVPIMLQTEPGQFRRCTTSRELSRRLVAFYEKDIEVVGRGRWRRDCDGDWSLDEFVVTDFMPLDDRLTFLETIEKMSTITGTEWQELQDPLGALWADRYGAEAPSKEDAKS